ncbi:hypothetical protein DQK91_12850 [Oceanidesulfovibrio marinus]|uniref:HTH araC/xylS-type domain-containing protein n=2 Tax=Oceanidesulfovibrio marinus TaxID=370038 RepID=A0A6P1ZF53_9BACT|nr:hypothetical protein DQK91_12850 [Oceanidesulfovibrio marinus]
MCFRQDECPAPRPAQYRDMIAPADVQPLLGNRHLAIQGARPSAALTGLIELLWSLPGYDSGQSVFDILPDSHFDLVFLLGEASCSALLSGPYTRKVSLPLEDSWELVCVRFRPGMFPRLADVKPSELVNGGVFLKRILGMDSDQLGERLKALSGIDSRKAFLEGLFHTAGLAEQMATARSRPCLAMIESCAGRITVSELARQNGMSVRTLERIFMEEVGVTAKMVIRYFRYRAALAGLRCGRAGTLADLALRCGYSDQSHFIKEFSFFAGASPGRL